MDSQKILVLETEKGSSEFAREEVLSVVERSHSGKVAQIDSGIFLVYGNCRAEDIAFAKRAGEVIGIVDNFQDISSIKIPEGKFYVRIIDTGKCHGTSEESEVGQLLGGKGRISFSNPDFTILAYHLDRWHICRQIYSRSNRERSKRKAPLRPFFSPVSMDPNYASFLINIGYFPAGATLLDPFCGGGGILIEAGLKGYKVEGIDILNEMAVGARMNLKYFGIRNFNITKTDFLEYEPDKKFDGIVTDFPYGRNSHISLERGLFYSKVAEHMAHLIETGSRACVVTDKKENLDYFTKFFTVDVVIPQKVHKSLTRYFTRMIKR